jgi:hypothetical protein
VISGGTCHVGPFCRVIGCLVSAFEIFGAVIEGVIEGEEKEGAAAAQSVLCSSLVEAAWLLWER